MLGQLTPATPAWGEQPQDVARLQAVSRSISSPPAAAPVPPLARRRRSCRTRSGNALSNASIGVLRVFVIAVWIPDPPVLVPATGAS